MKSTGVPRANLVPLFTVAILASGMTVLFVKSLDHASKSEKPRLTSSEEPPAVTQVLLERQIALSSLPPTAEASSVKQGTIESISAPATSATRIDVDAMRAEAAARITAAYLEDKPSTKESKLVEQQFRRALTDPALQGVHVDKLECRATVCQLEGRFDSSDADHMAFHRLLSEIASTGYSFAVPVRNPQRDGSVNVTAYMFAPKSAPEPVNPEEFPKP